MIDRIKEEIKVGMIFDNPGGGTSEIVSMTNTGIYYKRKNSKMLIKYSDIKVVYENFKGKVVTTKDLKLYNSKVFDSKKGGHSCNCTVLFMLLEQCGYLEGGILGYGKSNSPFYVNIKMVYN